MGIKQFKTLRVSIQEESVIRNLRILDNAEAELFRTEIRLRAAEQAHKTAIAKQHQRYLKRKMQKAGLSLIICKP